MQRQEDKWWEYKKTISEGNVVLMYHENLITDIQRNVWETSKESFYFELNMTLLRLRLRNGWFSSRAFPVWTAKCGLKWVKHFQNLNYEDLAFPFYRNQRPLCFQRCKWIVCNDSRLTLCKLLIVIVHDNIIFTPPSSEDDIYCC